MKKVISLLLVLTMLFSFTVVFADIIVPEQEGNAVEGVVVDTDTDADTEPEQSEDEEPFVPDGVDVSTEEDEPEEVVTEQAGSSEGNVDTVVDEANPTTENDASTKAEDDVLEEKKAPSPLGAIIAIVCVIVIVGLVAVLSKGN